MTKLTSGVGLCIAVVALTGCSLFGSDGYFRDRSDDYRRAGSLPPLQLPEGISAKHEEELYEIPQIARVEDLQGKFEVPRPQPLSVNVGLDRVKIQKLGNRRWVLVSQPPAEVWPQLHHFLRSSGLQLAVSDASAGVLETVWLRFESSPETKDKYRLQVESGVQPDTTEIHVRHLSMPADAPVDDRVDWPAQSTNPEREDWMIDEMSTALATEYTGAAASLVAQAIGDSTAKVQLAEPAGSEPYLAMKLAMNRAWATVAHAVNSGGYRLHQEDFAAGIFYVTYDERREQTDSEEDGWLFWGDKGEDELAEAAEKVTLEQVLANIDLSSDTEPALFKDIPGVGSAPEATEYPGYLVVLRGTNDQIEVRVRNSRGQPLSRAKASQLLLAIRQNLI